MNGPFVANAGGRQQSVSCCRSCVTYVAQGLGNVCEGDVASDNKIVRVGVANESSEVEGMWLQDQS